MKSKLSANHLLRQFVLFVLTILLVLAVIRAAYGLWQFPKIADADAFLPLFVQGLRFDLALIGQISIVPVVVGSLLSIFNVTRGLAKFVIVLFLMVGLFLVLTLELLTPWFISVQGVRPDLAILGNLEDPMTTIKSVFSQHTVPMIIGILVSVLILIAFWVRLEMSRFLRYRVSAPSGILLALVGGIACLVAIWSTPDIRQPVFSPTDAMISTDATVNDLAMNTTYKAFHSMVSPWLTSAGL